MAGPMGMSLFFCLSGFLIVSTLDRDQSIYPFLVKRVFRIVPAVALYLVIVAFLFGLPLEEFALNLIFMSNYYTHALDFGPVSHLWSLCVEMHFYFAIALVTAVLGRRGLWLVVPAALLVTFWRVEAGAYVNINTHLRVDEILMGGTLALVSNLWGAQIKRVLSNKTLSWIALTAVAFLWMASCHPWGLWFNYPRPYLAALLVGIVIHSDLPALRRALENRVAAYVAKISYALYIYHPMMVFGFMNEGSIWTRYLIKRPISYLLSWGASHLSTMYWEVPWQKLARRHLRSRGY